MVAIKKKGLGRGLEALLGDKAQKETTAEINRLPLTALQAGKYQPRTHMDQASLMSLADSIKAQGIMQPIVVRAIAQDQYEIIAGERRWRASQLAGMLEVPVIVKDIPDEAALAMALALTSRASSMPRLRRRISKSASASALIRA